MTLILVALSAVKNLKMYLESHRSFTAVQDDTDVYD
jgi:hypothetical protein